MYYDVCWLPISQLFVVPSRASVSAWRCAGPRQSQHILGVAAWTRTVIYWLSAPAITDSAHKCHVFGGHFNPISLARSQTCDQQFAQMSVLSSGDQRAIGLCHVIESDEPRDCGKSIPSLVTFVSRHHD